MARQRQAHLLRFRHPHGGTGCGSAHKTFFTSLASYSKHSSTLFSAGKWFHGSRGCWYCSCPASKNVYLTFSLRIFLQKQHRKAHRCARVTGTRLFAHRLLVNELWWIFPPSIGLRTTMRLQSFFSSKHAHSYTTRRARLGPTGRPIRWSTGPRSGRRRSAIQNPGGCCDRPLGLPLGRA
jgi:hypothetical protein